MIVKWLYEGLAWRWEVWRRTRYLRRTFRNGDELVRSYLAKTPCGRAVCQDGSEVRHPPGRVGFAQMILEVWWDDVYTRDFYTPSAGDVVVDAGANIGLFSLLVARKQLGCKVIAFEPFEENYQLLLGNLSAAKVQNVEVVQAALGGSTSIGVMNDGGRRSQDHRLTPAPDAEVGPDAVKICSFSDMIALAGTAQIALLKCDIEGSEHDFIGQAESADLAKVRKYAIEYHDHVRPGTLALLQDRLRTTHDLEVHPDKQTPEYGMIYASTKTIYNK